MEIKKNGKAVLFLFPDIRIDIIEAVDENYVCVMLFRKLEIFSVFENQGVDIDIAFHTPFDGVGKTLDIADVAADIIFRHDEAVFLDGGKIFFGKILFPVKRDIAAFDDEVLVVFDSGFCHFTGYGPKIFGEFFVIFRGEVGIFAADKAHF